MKNSILKFAVGTLAASSLLLAGTALASSNISNIKFANGQTTTSCTAGQSVTATIYFTTPANEVVEVGQSDVLGDSLSPSLPFSLGGDLGMQEGPNEIQVTFTCPQNTGYYTPELKLAGIFGGDRAVNVTQGVTSSNSFPNAIHVVAGTSTGTSGGSSNTIPQWFLDWQASQNAGSAGQTAAMKAKCDLIKPYLSATEYAYSPMGIQLQSALLLDNPYSIPALAAGSTVKQGYFGPQTHAALSAYMSANKCSN